MSAVEHVWPSDVPKSLWNYEALQQAPDIPFMGYQFSGNFYLAFFAGAAIIVFFAVRHFNTHSSEPDRFDLRALRELKPMDLRASGLMWRAYARYVGVLLMIYLALTLFGNLIFKFLNNLPPVAGLQVDAAGIDFDSPQWPLLISFGMVGFVPMVPFAERLERRLRAWAHRSAGIPIKITDQTNRVRRALDNLTGPAPDFGEAPAWLGKIAPEAEQKRAFRTRLQLRHLLDWSKDQRHYWPRAKAQEVLRNLEQEETRAAFRALEAFDDLLLERYDNVSAAESDHAAAGMAEAAGHFARPAKVSRAFESRHPAASADALVRHRRRLEREWNDLTARMEELRNELSSILVIFAEHDDRYHEIQNTELKRLIEEVQGDGYVEDGPSFWLYLALIPVAGVFIVAINYEQHPLLSSVAFNRLTIALSVLLSTAKTAILFCVPLSIVMAWRFVLRETIDSWVPLDLRAIDRRMVRRLLRAAGLALLSAAALLALLALLWAALISRNTERFVYLYLESSTPFLLFFTTLAGIAMVTTVITLIAVEYARIHKPAKRRPLVLLGLLNVALVLLWWGAHTSFWIGWGRCSPDSDGSEGFGQVFRWAPGGDCFETYSGWELVVYSVLAFCSACLFIPLADKKRNQRSQRQGHGLREVGRALLRKLRSFRVARLLPALAILGWSLVDPAAPRAQQITALPETVRIGFRKDVEPFSSFDNAENRYRGYLVDLCHRIFESRPGGAHDFTVVPVAVTAATRFDSFKPVPPPPEQQIDLLCDPTTLRFPQNKHDARDGGVFSPIIFISGVSYVSRNPALEDGDVALGYIKNSTAVDVAEQACHSDLFTVRPQYDSIKEEALYEKCKVVDECDEQKWQDLGEDDNGEKIRVYHYCALNSHADAIEWFCGAGSQKAYFGDRDIILGKLESVQSEGRCLDAESKNETYTYEPYALVINKENVELVRFVQRRIYQIFSNRDEIAAIFSGNFGGKQMAPILANLFLINAVEREE